jgi:site-specific DNA recombinase
MPRVAIYARYSSDKQRDASIEDQVRVCRELATREGWVIANIYTDHEISGASLIRPGIQQLLQDVLAGKTDIVVAEALDRISRDQEDVAGVYKRMQFAGVKMVTLSEGEITSLHIGLKGTMNAIFLKDLADKTRRGLRGRVEQGKSGGGNSFGYSIVKRIDERGEYARGERCINEEEAAIVRQIFTDYANGISPRAIASALNRQGINAPTGGEWGASTIYGNRERGTGILNNELYIGKLVWNRLRYMKDPDTGKRVSRPNPESEIIRNDVPEMRIIDQDLWDKVKALQGEYNKRDTPLWTKNRPKNLFSGLTKCGCCGGGFTLTSAGAMGCATARNKGTCDNRQTIKRDVLEAAVLNALRDHLMDEALCEEFCKAYTARVNELRIQHNASIKGYRAELARLEKAREEICDSICNGVPTEFIKDRAIRIQNRREELERLLQDVEEAPILFHPNMANRYHQEIRNLIASLGDAKARSEASRILRSLIDQIVLTPQEGEKTLSVDLIGDLAGILSVATKRGRLAIENELSKLQPVNGNDADEASEAGGNADPELIRAVVAGNRTGHRKFAEKEDILAMVAGAGFEPATFRL